MVILQGAFYGMAIGAVLGWMLGGILTDGVATVALLEIQARTFGLIGGVLGTLIGAGLGLAALFIRRDEEKWKEERQEEKELVQTILPR